VQVSGYFIFFDIDALCECNPKPADGDCGNCPACNEYGRDVLRFPIDQVEAIGDNEDIVLADATSICTEDTPEEFSFWATTKGDGTDNPVSGSFGLAGNVLTGLTTQQRKVAGGFAFTDKSVLSTNYEITGPERGTGRNLVFSALLFNCLPNFG